MSILTCFILSLIPYATSIITFNFTNINPNNSKDIIISGDAFYSYGDGIQLTNASEWLAGRATYTKLLQLWDKDSGGLAGFSTSFTFVMDSNGNNTSADGLTFFLAQNNSLVNPGGSFGLPFNFTTNSAMYPFVAVEFDTFGRNEWDPTDPNTNKPIGDHIASTGVWFEQTNVRSWAFKSTKLKVDGNKRLVPSTSPNATTRKNHTLRKVGLIVAILVIVFVLAILSYFLWRGKKSVGDRGDESERNNEIEIAANMPRRFSYHELARSTFDFAETEKLGEGGFGGVYKGFLKDLNIFVAVKRMSKSSKQGIKEYASEIRIISQLRHKNLVQLIGWCHEKEEFLLAYEFMENGSLDSHLFKRKSLLTWNTRYKIVLDLASALLYLHEEWEQCVLHRDIKSSNVMLDSNWNAKLGDFGLAKLVDHEKGAQTTMLAGTLGYMAPECVVTSRASKESDVYSFGVVVLEIACGRKCIEHMAQEKQIHLLNWVWELNGTGTLLEAVDPNLGSDFEDEEIKRLMLIGLWCVHPNPELRPSMRQVIKVLKFEASLPLLPLKMPIAPYLTPLRDVSSVDVSSVGQYESSSSISQH